MSRHLRLGVNIDHVATIRNARGGVHPDPVRAAVVAAEVGADGITAHLREDRRHISDADIERLLKEISLPLNLEMAATEEMLGIALRHEPAAACIVPEKREERTTEGGLDAIGGHNHLSHYIREMTSANIRVSLFIEPDVKQVEAAARLNAPVIELHVGAYCEASEGSERDQHYERVLAAAQRAEELGLECHAGHGISFDTVAPIAAIPTLSELNIGHFLVGEAIYLGFTAAIQEMRRLMDAARASAWE